MNETEDGNQQSACDIETATIYLTRDFTGSLKFPTFMFSLIRWEKGCDLQIT